MGFINVGIKRGGHEMGSQRWSDLPEDNLIQGIRRRVVTGEKLTIGDLYFPVGAVVSTHSHEGGQMAHVLSGCLRFILDGEEILIRQGEVLHIPSWVPHSAEALEETVEIDAFSPIRTDWLDGSDSYLWASSSS